MRSSRPTCLTRSDESIRVVALNVGHQTQHRKMARAFIDALVALEADILVLNEYVEARPREELELALNLAGLSHRALSSTREYRKSRWHNQVLIASRQPIELAEVPGEPFDGSAASNYLRVRTAGIDLTGLRAPAYERAKDWYAYWRWLSEVHGGDLLIGDFNCDPKRNNARDRVLQNLVQSGGWSIADNEGEWSYLSARGHTSRVDHAIFRGPLTVKASRYVDEPFAPSHTDHAALVVDFE